ncbi:hypothetical protein DMENIID0001_045700 [Sergentomyia squamirostris]
MKHMQEVCLFIAALSAVFPVADGCSSRRRNVINVMSHTPPPPPTTTTTVRPKEVAAPNFSECSGPFRAVYCLNGGSCFNFTIGHLHLPACQCAAGFMGERCELKYLHQVRAAFGAPMMGLARGKWAAVFLCATIFSFVLFLVTLLDGISRTGTNI